MTHRLTIEQLQGNPEYVRHEHDRRGRPWHTYTHRDDENDTYFVGIDADGAPALRHLADTPPGEFENFCPHCHRLVLGTFPGNCGPCGWREARADIARLPQGERPAAWAGLCE